MSGPRLSIIPAGAVTDRSLEPRDLQVLCLLGRHTDKLGWCFRSQVKMAEEIACGRASLQRSLERLYEAGWVEKRLRNNGAGTPDPKHPHAAHAYRVVLDRDDLIDEFADAPSHEENAEQAAGCPQVGTPSDPALRSNPMTAASAENGHPGARLRMGTGCPPIAGHNNDPSERPPLERERDARARERKAKGLVAFEARWPSAASDDRQRTAYAWASLTEPDEEAAISGIAPFLENQKRLGRKGVPAGWKYLEEKRWELLEKAKPDQPSVQKLAAGSIEAKAITVAYTIAGKSSVLTANFMRASDGGIYYRRYVAPRLLALAEASPSDQWVTLEYQQAAAWNSFLAEFVMLDVWTRLAAGSHAPWPWPPRKDGSISTGPPDTLMTADDEKALDQLGKMTG